VPLINWELELSTRGVPDIDQAGIEMKSDSESDEINDKEVEFIFILKPEIEKVILEE